MQIKKKLNMALVGLYNKVWHRKKFKKTKFQKREFRINMFNKVLKLILVKPNIKLQKLNNLI